MEELSSPMVVIHARAAPDTMAGNISGTVTLQKVRKGGTPRLTEASSTRTSIC
jgi:hypothetical protein